MPLPNQKRWYVAVRYTFHGKCLPSMKDFDHFGQAVDWVAADAGPPRTIARLDGRHLVRAGDSQKNLGYVR